MAEWTQAEINELDNASTLQNRPLNDDQQTLEEDNPVWEVTVQGKLYIRGAKGVENTKWYQAGVKNGGQVGINGKNYHVKYVPVTNEATIKAVTAAYLSKYNGQYPIDLMVSDAVAAATVELVKAE